MKLSDLMFMKLHNIIFSKTCIAFLMLLGVFTSCKPQSPLKKEAEAFGKKFCECAGPSAKLYDSIKALDGELTDSIMDVSHEFGMQMQDCLGQKYLDPFESIKPEEREKFDEYFRHYIRANCEKIADSFGI